MNTPNENWSRAQLIDKLGLDMQSPTIYEDYWTAVSQLPKDLQVGIAAKIFDFGRCAESEGAMHRTNHLPVHIDVVQDLIAATGIDQDYIDNLIDEGLRHNLSSRDASIYAASQAGLSDTMLAQLYKLKNRQIRSIKSKATTIIRDYVDTHSDIYRIWLSESNRNSNPHYAPQDIQDPQINRDRAIVEDTLDAETMMQVTSSGEVKNKIIVIHNNNRYTLVPRQLHILAMAICYSSKTPNTSIYIKQNKNSYDTVLILAGRKKLSLSRDTSDMIITKRVDIQRELIGTTEVYKTA